MLSTYLGEDQMLAVVCKSHAAARARENYQMDGNVNCPSALYILAAKLGISIKGQYLVLCLEDIRELYILFPVICLERQLPLSPEKVKRSKRIEELKLELNQLQDQMQEEIKTEKVQEEGGQEAQV